MPETPESKSVFQIGQFFAQLIQIPVRLVISINHQPSFFYLGALPYRVVANHALGNLAE
jgi:hypothetical protein